MWTVDIGKSFSKSMYDVLHSLGKTGKESFRPHLLLVGPVSLAVSELQLQACHFLFKLGHFLFLLSASGQVVVVGLDQTSLHLGFLLRPGRKDWSL